MKKIILAMGFGLFLLAFSMHLKTSVDSPMGLVTEEAMAQGTGTGGCSLNIGDCLVTNCWVSGIIYGQYMFWFNGCNSFCNAGGTNCCFWLNSGC